MKTASERKPGRPVDPELRHRREEEILDGAVRLFAQHGFAAANTQELADTIGVGKGTIYRYFPTKRELFLAAVDRGMRRLKSTIDEAIEGIEDPMELMARGVEAYLTFFNDRPDLVELLIQERAEFKDRPKPTYFIHRDANKERWHAMFRKLIAEGRLRPMAIERVNDVLGDLLYGTMFANYFTRRSRSAGEQAQDILDVVFHGILSEGERRRLETCEPAAEKAS